MNERIRELAEQAGVLMEDVIVDGVSVSKFIFPANEKFADLIVRECLSIADRRGAYEVMDDIIERFGVE